MFKWLFRKKDGNRRKLTAPIIATSIAAIALLGTKNTNETIESVNQYAQVEVQKILSEDELFLDKDGLKEVPFSEYLELSSQNPRGTLEQVEVQFFTVLNELYKKMSDEDRDKLEVIKEFIETDPSYRAQVENFCSQYHGAGTYNGFCEQMGYFLIEILDKYGKIDESQMNSSELAKLGSYKKEINKLFYTGFKGEVLDFIAPLVVLLLAFIIVGGAYGAVIASNKKNI